MLDKRTTHTHRKKIYEIMVSDLSIENVHRQKFETPKMDHEEQGSERGETHLLHILVGRRRAPRSTKPIIISVHIMKATFDRERHTTSKEVEIAASESKGRSVVPRLIT